MKKVILLMVVTLFTGSIAFAADTRSNATVGSAGPGYSYQIRRIIRREIWRDRHRERVTYETRIERKGRKTFRDTYRITWKNGRRHEKRVNRVRIN